MQPKHDASCSAPRIVAPLPGRAGPRRVSRGHLDTPYEARPALRIGRRSTRSVGGPRRHLDHARHAAMDRALARHHHRLRGGPTDLLRDRPEERLRGPADDVQVRGRGGELGPDGHGERSLGRLGLPGRVDRRPQPRPVRRRGSLALDRRWVELHDGERLGRLLRRSRPQAPRGHPVDRLRAALRRR